MTILSRYGALLLTTHPLYTGSDVSGDVPYPFHCAIAGHPYIIDTSKFQRGTIELTRSGFDPSGEPGEQTLSSEGVWKRWGDDWAYGTDQLNYDWRDSDRSRFYLSEGIDCWSERGQISLLKATEQKLSSANTNLAVLSVGSYLYVADGSNLKYTSDPTVASPSFTSTAAGATIQSITTDGAKVYAAIGTDIVQSTAGSGVVTTLSTQDATLVGYANGRLLAANANVLYEISSGGTATAIYTHFNASVTYVAIVGTPIGIFVGLNNGDRGEFLFVGFNATSGALATPLPAGALNRGETLYSMLYYQGTVALGTSRGLRVAQIVQDRGLAPGPAIEASSAVRCLDADGEYVWFGLTNGGTSATGLGRANLARETAPGVPAWANDVMAAATSGNVLSVARFGSRTYFAVSASGIWGENTNKVTSGYLDTGWIRFGTVERLVMANVDLFHSPLAGSIDVSVITEDGVTTALGSSDVASSIAPLTAISGNAVDSYAFRLKFTLNRDATTTTTGPTLLRWVLRSLVAPNQVERIIVPIILYSMVESESGDGLDIPVNVNAERAFLKGLESSRSIVQFQMFGESERVTVRRVETPEGAVRGWGDFRDSLDQVVYVHLMTMPEA